MTTRVNRNNRKKETKSSFSCLMYAVHIQFQINLKSWAGLLFLSVTHSFLDVVKLITVSVTPNLPSLWLFPASCSTLPGLTGSLCVVQHQATEQYGDRLEGKGKQECTSHFFLYQEGRVGPGPPPWTQSHRWGPMCTQTNNTYLWSSTWPLKLVLFILPKTCVRGPYNLYNIWHPEAGQYHLKSISQLIAIFTLVTINNQYHLEYTCAWDSPSSKWGYYSLCCK